MIFILCCCLTNHLVDAAAVTTLATTNDCASASAVTKDTSTGIIYVACGYPSGVIQITMNSQNHQPQATFILDDSECQYANDISTDSTGKLYVACFGRGVISIDTTNSNAIEHLGGTNCPSVFFVDKALGSDVVASCGDNPAQTMNSVGTTEIVSVAGCPFSFYAVKDTVSGGYFIACAWQGSSSDSRVLSVKNGIVKIIAASSDCWDPRRVAFNPTTNILYAICAGDGQQIARKVVGIDVSQTTPMATTILTDAQCSKPSHLFIDTAANALYVSCENGHTVNPDTPSVVSVLNGQITPLIKFNDCTHANSVFKDLATNQVYVTCSGEDSQFSSIIVTTIGTGGCDKATLSEGLTDGSCTTSLNSGESCTMKLVDGYVLSSGSLTLTCNGNSYDQYPIVTRKRYYQLPSIIYAYATVVPAHN